MWYRIAIGAGLFLIGYTLGRGFNRIEAQERESRSTRIREAIAEHEEHGPRDTPQAAPATESGEDIVRK
jgi:hypothetical protein